MEEIKEELKKLKENIDQIKASEERFFRLVNVLGKTVTETPNDQMLGKKIRELFYRITKEEGNE